MKGKAKELFEKWYLKLPNSMGLNYGIRKTTLNRFYCSPNAMQWGVIQEWADSLGFDVYYAPYYDWTKERDTGYKWYCSKREDDYLAGTGLKDSISEARDAAIEKLCQLINEK